MNTGAVPPSIQSESTASFGYWVRRRRLALDLTQAELAHEVGCARITVSKIERDERRPSRQMAELLADRLSIPEEERHRFLAVARGERTVDVMPLPHEPVDSPASTGDQLPPRNLPTPSTPFVGREAELAQLLARLDEPACRLLTLVGPGGFGKTRLAIRLGELASERPDLAPDGVFFVALDGLENSELVVPAIAAALGFSFHEQAEQATQLLSFLRSKQLLLILDNAEGVLDAGLAVRILGAAPDLKMLVTSREALNVREEWFHPISGMSLDGVEDSQQGELDAGHRGDALNLFYRCAVRVRPDFDLELEAAHVWTICRTVGGVPLAIELAAAWLKALTCEQVARDLIQGIDILTSSMHDVPERHRSLRAVLEQTWHHLSDEERRVFRQLSIFAGGFRRAAAQAVTGASLPVLAGLVDKSVLQLGQDGRYRIHDLLRQMGVEQLVADPEEAADVADRHSIYYLRFLRNRNQSISGPDQRQVLLEVQAEMDNIGRAWGYAARQEDFTGLEDALPCLYRFLWENGRFSQGMQILSEALGTIATKPTTRQDLSLRVRVGAICALFAAATGQTTRASEILKDIQIHEDTTRNSSDLALVLYVRGMIATYDYVPRAYPTLAAAYEMYQILGDELAAADTGLRLNFIVSWMMGDYSEGRKLVEESLRIYRKIGNILGVANALESRAVLLAVYGLFDEAEQDCRESLELAHTLGTSWIEAKAFTGICTAAIGRGEFDSALDAARKRLTIMEGLGHQHELDISYSLFGDIYTNAFRYEEASELVDLHPALRAWAWSEQALIAVGRYEEAMETLPGQTSIIVEGGWRYYSVDNLTSWAMLLTSACPLLRNGSPPSRAYRMGMAREILTVVRSYNPDRSRAVSRAYAAKLLTKLEEPVQAREPAAESRGNTPRSVLEIARELLTIRLA